MALAEISPTIEGRTSREVARLERRIMVLRAMKGDARAFESLFNDFHPRLLYYARRMVRDHDRAEDVMQDVWIAIYKDISDLRDPDAFRLWSYRVTRNVALQHFRKFKEPTVSLEEIPERADAASNEVLAAASVEEVHKALEQLGSLHREVLLLKYFEDLSYEEIAELTDSNVGTVRSRLYYAKSVMSEIIKGSRK